MLIESSSLLWGWEVVAPSLEADAQVHILAATVFVVILNESLTFSKQLPHLRDEHAMTC